MKRVVAARSLLVALLTLALAACEYEPPPEVELATPETGTSGLYCAGEPLVLRFSAPIRPDSLRLRVWPEERDEEGRYLDGVEPLLDDCGPGRAGCRATAIAVASDGLSAEVALDPEGVGAPGAPRVLEVRPGLRGRQGPETGTSFEFGFQVVPGAGGEPDGEPGEVVPFENGVYVIVGSLTEPAPAVMTYITHVATLPDGRLAMAGAEGDELGDAPKNTSDPTKLRVDDGDEGYTVFAVGRVTREGDKRFLQTEPIEIDIVTGPFGVLLSGVQLVAEVVERDGHDGLEGMFVFERARVTVGESSGEFEGGSTPLVGVWAPSGTCEEGAPDLCGDLCGAVVRGKCEPPADFPPEAFCAEMDEEGEALSR